MPKASQRVPSRGRLFTEWLSERKFIVNRSFPLEATTIYSSFPRQLPRYTSTYPQLSELTTTMVAIVKNLTTVSLTYTTGVANLEFTLGLTEHLDDQGKKSICSCWASFASFAVSMTPVQKPGPSLGLARSVRAGLTPRPNIAMKWGMNPCPTWVHPTE